MKVEFRHELCRLLVKAKLRPLNAGEKRELALLLCPDKQLDDIPTYPPRLRIVKNEAAPQV